MISNETYYNKKSQSKYYGSLVVIAAALLAASRSAVTTVESTILFNIFPLFLPFPPFLINHGLSGPTIQFRGIEDHNNHDR